MPALTLLPRIVLRHSTRHVRRLPRPPPSQQSEASEEEVALKAHLRGATPSGPFFENPGEPSPYPPEEIKRALRAAERDENLQRNKLAYGRERRDSRISFAHLPIQDHVVVLFPGQGAQHVGMGQKVLDCPAARDLFERASASLGYDLAKLCKEGPKTKLEQTIYCQPAVFVSSLAAWTKLRTEEPELADRLTDVAGFSVGEFAALVAGGILSFDDALTVVKKRADAMHDCNQIAAAGMLTVKVNAASRLEDAMKEAKRHAEDQGEPYAVCEIANYLVCGLKVIGGTNVCLEQLEKNADRCKFTVVKRLPVSGAFHTSLQTPARQIVKEALKEVQIREPVANVYSNYTGAPHSHKKSELRLALAAQVDSPVKWEQIQQLLFRKHQNYVFPSFIEVGPGKQLGAMLAQTSKKLLSHYTNYTV